MKYEKCYDNNFLKIHLHNGLRSDVVGDKIYLSHDNWKEFKIYDPSKYEIFGRNLILCKSRMNFSSLKDFLVGVLGEYDLLRIILFYSEAFPIGLMVSCSFGLNINTLVLDKFFSCHEN